MVERMHSSLEDNQRDPIKNLSVHHWDGIAFGQCKVFKKK